MNMQITKEELTDLASRKLWHGEYIATDNFRKIEKHASVCFEDGALVAVTGKADDRESQLYAALFADAPAMLLEVARLREALEIAADALANEDLSQSEKMYEANRARSALKVEENG
jgi:hypothetical protein